MVYSACVPLTHVRIRKLCYRKDDHAVRPIYECLSCLFTESD